MNKMNLAVPALALAAALVALPAHTQQAPENQPADTQRPAEDAELPPVAVPQPSAAGQERTVMVVVGSSLTWDSNVFRLPDSADPQAQLGRSSKSDRISTTYAGLRVDKQYAQQRFLLDATVTAIRYRAFSYLDFDPVEYRGEWQWHLTPRVSGALGADRSQALANYGDFRNASQRNVLINENRRLSVDGWLFGGWHLLGGLRQREINYSVPFPQVGSFRETAGEAGLKYLAGTAASLTVNFRSTSGHYTDRVLDPVALLDDGFTRSESELLATWIVTGKSTLDARLARVDYRSNHFAERSFSGTAATLGHRWAATGKLSVNLAFSRELQPWEDSSASYRVDQRLSLGPLWQMTDRTALRLSLGREARDYRNPVAGFTGTTRRDTLRSAQIALDWRLLRNLSVNASLQRQRQTSTDPAFEFEAGVATLGASLKF